MVAFLFAYDATQATRRRQLAHLLARHGSRVHASCFMLDSPAPHALEEALRAAVLPPDQLLLSELTLAQPVFSWGAPLPATACSGLLHL